MPFPFEVPFEEVQASLDSYVDEVFGALQSEFLTLPKGVGFVEYPIFEHGYEVLKRITHGFRELSPEPVIQSIYEVPIVFVVLRTILGFTPPEWAYVTTQRLTENEFIDFSRLWHDGCVKAIIEAQDVDRNHPAKV